MFPMYDSNLIITVYTFFDKADSEMHSCYALPMDLESV